MRSRRRAEGRVSGGVREGESGRHRSRRRRRRREGRDYIGLPDGEEKPKEDPLEQRSIALVVLFAVIILLAICFSIIAISLTVESTAPF